MRQMLLAVAAVVCAGAASAAVPQKLEVRLVVECQPDEAAMVLVGSNEQYCLAKDTVFDGSGVVKVQRYPVTPKAVIQLSQAASDRLYDVSYEKAGERLGFVFNGRLIWAPVLVEPVKTTELYLTLKNDPDDIDALVAAFPGDVAAK